VRLDGGGRRGVVVIGDDTVYTDNNVVDLRDERVEAARNNTATTKSFDIADFVENE
jgi:hypothetical protein